MLLVLCLRASLPMPLPLTHHPPSQPPPPQPCGRAGQSARPLRPLPPPAGGGHPLPPPRLPPSPSPHLGEFLNWVNSSAFLMH